MALVTSLLSGMTKTKVTLNNPNIRGLTRIFDAVDTDRSGAVTLNEIKAFSKRVLPQCTISFDNYEKDFAAAGKTLDDKLKFEDSLNALIGLAVDGLLIHIQ
jgi:hypothetical protein